MTDLFINATSGAIASSADYNTNFDLIQVSFADLGPWVVTGLVPSAGAGLAVTVTAGTASIGGRITASGSFSIAGLTNSTTNHLYLKDDGTGTSNTTAVQPADSVKLGTATTSGGAVTSVNVLRSSGRQTLVRHENQVAGAVGSMGSISLASWNATAGDGFQVYGSLPVGAMPAIAFDDLSDVTLTSQAQGDTVYRNASAWVNLPAGTAGQVFVTNGAAANPAWSSSVGALTFTGDLTLSTHNLITDTSTGTKIGTSATQKLGFFNATPIVQPANTTDLRGALINLGLYATGGATPLDLNGGSLTASGSSNSLGATTFTGNVTVSTKNLVTDTSTGTQIATGSTQKLGFFGATPVAQISGSTDILAGMVTLGFRAASSNPPLNMGTGALTAGATSLGGDLTLSTHNLITDTSTGTQIATGSTQKLGFYGATPVAQISGSTDVLAGFVTQGLRAASSNPPFNIGTGAITAGNGTFSGTVSSPGAGSGSEHFGASSTAAGTHGTAFGNTAVATNLESTAIGYNASVTGDYGTAIGTNASVTATNGTVIGRYSTAALNAVAIGPNVTASANSTVVIGISAKAETTDGVAIGDSASASGSNTVCFGAFARAGVFGVSTSAGSTCIGRSAIATSSVGMNTLLGYNTGDGGFGPVVCIGAGATATANNQMVVGGVNGLGTVSITDVYIGKGVTSTAPAAVAVNATGGSGTDVTGANILFAGGKGTGNNGGGDLIFQSTRSGQGSATTLRTLEEVYRISAAGVHTITGHTSTSDRSQLDITPTWATSTDASRKARAVFNIWDTAAREAMRLEADGSNPMIGFLGATAVARPTAYTQTYSTATRTHNNVTSSAVSTTAATQTTPWGYATQAQADAIPVAINAVAADLLNLKQLVNSLIDDLQSNGLLA